MKFGKEIPKELSQNLESFKNQKMKEMQNLIFN
jgi:hypothetical protein